MGKYLVEPSKFQVCEAHYYTLLFNRKTKIYKRMMEERSHIMKDE